MKQTEKIKGLEVQEFKIFYMGKYYENLDTLIQLIQKLEKRNILAEFILDCISTAKKEPTKTIHEIIKEVKQKRLKS